MKPVRHRLLVALCLLLLSTTTSIILAQPPRAPIERPSAAPSGTTAPAEVVEKKPQPTPQNSTKVAQPDQILEAISRRQKFIEADRLYLRGQIAAAEKLYREVKVPFVKESTTRQPLEPILDPTQLSPAGKVYWRETEAGITQKLQSRILVPLRLLVEQYPEFIPGHLRLAEVLQQYEHPKEALGVLEQATSLYPAQPDLLKAKVAALAATKQWMEASLAARQFALLNPKQPQAPEFAQLADENLKRYRKHIRSKLRGNAIANVLTGALGYALTGSLLGPFSAVQTTTMLLRGESDVGESVAKQARKQLEIVEDKVVVDYVNEVGQKLARVAGRNDFKYEFSVVLEDDLNAFALPGGKVFINAGAITRIKSEAELAGLLAHELSHAVLSHGFQLVAEGNLIANVTQFVPLGGTIADLFTLDYNRDMERQADNLGTRLIASKGYAADGLRNLMVTLKQQQKSSPPIWLASHPAPANRVRYLENLIERNGYNRYAYEGVARHAQINERVRKLLVEKEQREEKKRREK